MVNYTPVEGGYKHNEQIVRNLGVDLSIKHGCTHHISSDVDEMYDPDQLQYAKNEMKDHDSSIVCVENYFKHPTYLITPNQGHVVSLIHPVSSRYDMKKPFPRSIEMTRKTHPNEKCRVFTKDEFVIHHMSFIRRDIREKMYNSPSWPMYNQKSFLADFDKYKLGERIQVAPDFKFRKTTYAPNKFGIDLGE